VPSIIVTAVKASALDAGSFCARQVRPAFIMTIAPMSDQATLLGRRTVGCRNVQHPSAATHSEDNISGKRTSACEVRNAVRNHPGIAFTILRIPQSAPVVPSPQRLKEHRDDAPQMHEIISERSEEVGNPVNCSDWKS
jgi:hypothetical protein